MIETQPGEGRNDIMGLAFLVAFAAFLINGHQRRAPAEGAVQDAPERDAPLLDKGPLVMAGIAAGLAVSVKLPLLAPVGAIALGMVLVSGRGRRLTTALSIGVPAFVVGGYWYVRAAIHTGGNPIPQIGWGPLHLPRPDQMPLDPRPRFAVADYLFEPTIYRKWFFPQLDNALGPLFPLILVIAVAAAVYIAFRSRNLILRVLARRGAADRRRLHRHAADRRRPGGLADRLLHQHPLPDARPAPRDGDAADRAAAARPRRARLADAALPHRRLRHLGADDAALVPGLHRRHRLPHPGAGLGADRVDEIARAAGDRPGGRHRGGRGDRPARGRPRPRPGGSVLQAPLHENDPLPAGRRAAEGLRVRPQPARQADRHRRLGEIFFGQYGFYGKNLDNYVQYIGVPGSNGAYRLATDCATFRERVNVADYDYLIVSRFTADSLDSPYWYRVYYWLRTDPAVKEIITEADITPQPDYVFRVNGKLDPAACPAS